MSEGETRLPGMNDFAPEAVRRAIRKESLTHPATLYPGVVGILGAVAWGLFGAPVLLGVSFGAFLLSLTGLTVNYFFRDGTIARRYVEFLKKQLAEKEEDLLRNLQQDLMECRDIAAADRYVRQGSDQFDKIRRKYDNLNKLVEDKLGSGELSLGGVWAAAEQVYLGVLENLRNVVNSLHSISTIDPLYISDRLNWLSGIEKPDDADLREMETLRRRERLRVEQLQRVNEYLTRNEEALTRLEEATIAVAAIRSDDGFTGVDTEHSVERLRELAREINERQGGLRA
ncbi:MAG: hypothetical protein RDU20_01215 [Desulfomonilaceae bacterium]|nr:hypothetical protein [Desulfomonilaceae bacterium]